ncbi:MAG: nuclear transport factor 2 family protein [Pseudomonadota bacterium]
MKRLAVPLFAGLALTAASPAPAQPMDADEAAIRTIVEGVALYADRGEFDRLETLFAPEVRVDYSSLSGEPVSRRAASALLTDWAELLPGFDRTHHAISNIAVTLSAAEAEATADISATHWIGTDVWQVDGRYDYRLTRDGDDWRIVAMTFTLIGEAGSRAVTARAAEAARADPANYVVRRQTRQAVLDFLTGLEDKDMDRVNALWADDAVQDMPYVPEGFPSRIEGREALIRQYAAWPDTAGDANFTDELVFHPLQDPEWVFAEYRGVSEIVPTGRIYDQRYGGLFHVENGRIKLFREYFDPRVFAHAFGLEEGGDFYGE